MKKILSLLLSVVFLHVQTAPLLAKRGGPDFGDGGGNVDIVGTYSGTLVPTSDDETATGTPSVDGESLNSLGLFSLGLPAEGAGTGSFVIFTQGYNFVGTITAVGDPGRGSIKGLVEASYDFVDFAYDQNGNILVDNTGAPILQDYTAIVRGTLSANVVQSSEFDPTDIQSVLFNISRIEGEAQMGVIFAGGITNQVLNYIVDGVKQSTNVAASTDLGGGTLGN